MVYQNDTLQFISHEEGRIRYKAIGNSFQYDYMLKDHLGNVRMVLTEEQQQDQYPATTVEGVTTAGTLSMINYEKQFYTINNTYVVNTSTMPGWTTAKDYQNNNGNPPANSSYPASTTPISTAISAKVYKLNAATNKTGLGMVLKVMAGDKIDIHGKSYYQTATTYNNTNSTVITLADIIGAFTGSPDNAGFGTKGITSGTMQTINTGLIPSTFIRGNDNTSSTVPKAYINYIFFDEQFKYAGGNFSRVGTSGTVKNHWFADAQLQNITIPRNGYLYVYVSNESNADVFFDNLQVFHTRGPLVSEQHVYPWGLEMQAISSSTANFAGYTPAGSGGCGCPNKKGFNGNEIQQKEFSDGSGLNVYDFNARTYDQQIGRFIQVDPLIEFGGQESLTPYQFSYNDPIRYNDPDGRCPCFFAIPYIITGAKIVIAGGIAYFGTKAVVDNVPKLEDIGYSAPAAGPVVISEGTRNTGSPLLMGTSSSAFSSGTTYRAESSTAGTGINSVVNAAAKNIQNSKASKASSNLPDFKGKGPKGNDGNAKKHGGDDHNDAIDSRVKELNNDATVIDIRKNQVQVDLNGNRVGNNKPDIQYNKLDEKTGKWTHHNVEYDTKAANSVNHGKAIKENDPNASVELNVLKNK
jgi:RHS repeat-associated protein